MGKNTAKNIVVHGTSGPDFSGPEAELNGFFAEAVERRLLEWNLNLEQKLAVLDRLIEKLREREKKAGD